MKQILISVKDKEKAKLLLKSLDFVEEVESRIQADSPATFWVMESS